MIETLYHIIEETQDSILVQLNQDHEVFKAHFPNNPILPGACIMAIAKDLLCQREERDFIIEHVKTVKFVQTIDPRATDVIRYIFEKLDTSSDTTTAKISVTDNDRSIVFTRINITCRNA